MTTLHLETEIEAPIEKVFDLSRSIDFHINSASQTQEEAIGGRTSGLISLNETVTWRGKHFGVFLKHTSKIISFQQPTQFTDIMIKGHFTYFAHQHFFRSENGITLMEDVIKYRTPYGFFGRLFDRFFLKNHLLQFIKTRNQAIKARAEGSQDC